MEPKELAAHKAAPKFLTSTPAFKPLKRGKLPKPLNKIGGARVHSTELIQVSDTHRAAFIWRDGETVQDTGFYAWLFCVMRTGALYPLFEFHYHPSHKGFHCKTPCKTTSDYTNRCLPGAPELAIKTPSQWDPRIESDRSLLLDAACRACGITLGGANSLWNK